MPATDITAITDITATTADPAPTLPRHREPTDSRKSCPFFGQSIACAKPRKAEYSLKDGCVLTLACKRLTILRVPCLRLVRLAVMYRVVVVPFGLMRSRARCAMFCHSQSVTDTPERHRTGQVAPVALTARLRPAHPAHHSGRKAALSRTRVVRRPTVCRPPSRPELTAFPDTGCAHIGFSPFE